MIGSARNVVIAIWIALVAAGLIVAWAVQGAGPLPGDLALTGLLQAWLPFDTAMGRLLVYVGEVVWVLPFLAVLVALAWRQWMAALFITLGSITSLALGEMVIKRLVARPRPPADLVQVYEPAASSSFPSSTSLLACVLVGLVSYFVWRARSSRPASQRSTSPLVTITVAVALLLLVLSGIARVYVGAHWASDVLGSWLFGGAWLLVVVAAHRWWLTRRTGQHESRKEQAWLNR